MQYRFYPVRDGHAIDRPSFVNLLDDASALLHAVSMTRPDTGCEVWCGVQLIAIVPPGRGTPVAGSSAETGTEA